MVTVIAILMILVCFNFALKQTFNPWRTIMGVSVVVFGFVVCTWPLAIKQSQTRIAEWLASQSLMQDMAVILSLDVILQLLFCFFALQPTFHKSSKLRQKLLSGFLTHYPGFAIFPVVFALLVQIIFGLPGISFSLIAYSFAIGVAVAIPLAAYLLRLLLPEGELRLEVLFLSNLLMAMMGVLATVKVSTQQSPNDGVDWLATLFVLLFLVAGVALGMLWRFVRDGLAGIHTLLD